MNQHFVTAVMLAHLDAALDELEKETRQKGRAYMFDAYRLRYMEAGRIIATSLSFYIPQISFFRLIHAAY